MIRVRLAGAEDRPRLIEFIRDHWSATHIFVERPEVFVWQHLQHDGRLNMVFADDDSGNVLGVLGFIPMGRFDPTLGDRDVALAIWKVRELGTPPGLGLRLLKFLQAELAPRLVAAIGISSIVRPIYRVLGYEVGALGHVAIFHPGRAGELRVASGVPDAAFEPAPPPRAGTVEFIPIDEHAPETTVRDVDSVCSAASPPVKSWRYIVDRYLGHPWYRYEVRAVVRHGAIAAVVVWRAVAACGSLVLRIVDVVGDTEWLRDSRGLLQQEVIAAGAEYIDVVHWGVDEAVLADAGFVGPGTVSGLVLPNYFSPFERRNVTIEAAVKMTAPGGPVHLYRADSDQDRPNLARDLEPLAR